MQNWLSSGNWNALCDSCGRKFKASSLRQRWDGLMVCKEDYEVRHPQDFLRVQEEKISVPWARPYPEEDTFLFYCTLENGQGLSDIGVADCMRADYVSPIQLETPGISANDYPAIAGVAIPGYSIAGLIHTQQPGV